MSYLLAKNSHIGIWGYGVVGKSVATYLFEHNYKISVADSDSTKKSDNFLQESNIPFFSKENLHSFFKSCSVVIPSPGIDTSLYHEYSHLFASELDLFCTQWKKPLIAITGTVGKTTVTDMIGQICAHNKFHAAVGGNIGTPLFDLISQQNHVNCAVLELSSFQLEYATTFAPDIAYITNFSLNHLDRHKTLEEYWQAKTHIFTQQKAYQHCIVPLSLFDKVQNLAPRSCVWFITEQKPTEEHVNHLNKKDCIVYSEHNSIKVYKNNRYQTLKKPKPLFQQTFLLNALGIAILLHLMHKVNNNAPSFFLCDLDYQKQPHRLEHVATYKNITYINDSKSTTCASTLAAINTYNNRSLYLILGGLSKGADRKAMIAQLPKTLQYIACFGAEALELATWCKQYAYKSDSFTSLSEALDATQNMIKDPSVVLFSPSGSSFDLYESYIKRGEHFKDLVYHKQP